MRYLALFLFTALDPQFILQDRNPTRVAVAKEFDPVECHNRVKSSGSFNCLDPKIQLSELIDFDCLEGLAPDYWDHQLFTSLRFGFPLDYNRAMVVRGVLLLVTIRLFNFQSM